LTIIAIDFEASCLPRHGRSFPIEVGIASGDGLARSWIIRPHDSWAAWDWTAEAEALHGLTRARILAEGLPAGQVLRELENAVRGRRLVADSAIDQYWLDTLAHAAGTGTDLRIGHVTALFDELGVTGAAIRAATAHADRTGAVRHRAAGDARWLAAVIGALGHGAQPPVEESLEAAQ
jgi:hypothetical protein